MNDLPLLSVIIATKNREEYCIEAIKSILTIPGEAIEITVADNSETNKIEKFLQSNPSDRVIYQYDKSEISSIENFNRAIGLSSGEYICLIGDDDTVLPDILNIANWMKSNNIETVCSKKIINYFWPNAHIPQYNSGELVIPEFTGAKELLDVESTLEKLIRDGILNYQIYCLPRIYHGIVKRSVVERIKKKTGWYFGGLTPDIYSTVTLSCFVKKHYVVDYPFTIAGACPASTSVASLTGGHSGVLESAPHFKDRGNYVWEKEIPRYYSVETLWAETALKALREMDRNDLALKMNHYRFFTYAIYANRKYIFNLTLKETMKLYSPLNLNKYVFYLKLFSNMGFVTIGGLISKIAKRVTKKTGAVLTKHAILNLSDVTTAVKSYLLTNKLSFKNE